MQVTGYQACLGMDAFDYLHMKYYHHVRVSETSLAPSIEVFATQVNDIPHLMPCVGHGHS